MTVPSVRAMGPQKHLSQNLDTPETRALLPSRPLGCPLRPGISCSCLGLTENQESGVRGPVRRPLSFLQSGREDGFGAEAALSSSGSGPGLGGRESQAEGFQSLIPQFLHPALCLLFKPVLGREGRE